MTIKAISLFSGCGGFDYGAHLEGVNIIWANDIDPAAASAYRSIFPNTEFILGDVRDVSVFPSADILIGCYPCTGFSLAARRKWKNRSERDLMEIPGNFLYQEFLRVLDQTQPKFFFVENVIGMVSAQKGWFFNKQLEGFRERGYVVTPKQLNAVDYGVAQSRKRVFLVGARQDISQSFKYDFHPATHGIAQQDTLSLKDVIGDMPLDPRGEYYDGKFHGHYLTRNRKRAWDQPSYTVVANASHVPLHPSGDPMVFVEKDKWKLQGDFNRRLSWKECARIQGLPDMVNPEGTLHDKYRVIGNAVPPRFGQILVKPILEYFHP